MNKYLCKRFRDASHTTIRDNSNIVFGLRDPYQSLVAQSALITSLPNFYSTLSTLDIVNISSKLLLKSIPRI